MKRQVVLLLMLLTTLACSDDDILSDDADLTGSWAFVAVAASPPTTLACSSGHSGLTNMALCSPFDLVFQETAGGYSGTSSQKYCGADWTATAVLSGNSLAGEVVGDDDTTVVRFNFSGTLTGDTATIDPGIYSVDGLSGNCTTIGFYNAVR